jgi:hypothetical protein
VPDDAMRGFHCFKFLDHYCRMALAFLGNSSDLDMD